MIIIYVYYFMYIIYVYFIIPKIIRRVTQKVWENVN